MTESEWVECTDPASMMGFLWSRPISTDRKVRCFLVACCRAAWQRLKAPESRHAVELAERYIDGPVSRVELAAAANAAWKVRAPRGGDYAAAYLAVRSLEDDFFRSWAEADSLALISITRHVPQAHALLRDVLGLLPFRTVALDPAWLEWNDAAIVRLAQAIYEEKAFGQMPVLADALEQAGCDNREFIEHCRKQEGHVRGCWVVDLILGKS